MTDIEALVAAYRGRLPAYAERIEAELRAMESERDAAALRLRAVAHELRGSGGSYGFPEISDAARAVELAADDELHAAASSLAAILRDVAAGTAPRRTILVVDDDPAIQQLVAVALAAPGRRVLASGTIAEALAQLASTAVDLVVLDLVLPDGDGRSLLRQLRDQSGTADLPVIAITARLGPLVREELEALRCSAILEKPLDPKQLGAIAGAQLEARAAGAHQARAQPMGTAPRQPAAEAARSVLVVEDDDLTAAVVRHRLSRAGFTVEHVTSGTEALERVAAKAPDLVVLDVHLPGLDGFQVLERIRGTAATAEVPVLMLTALGVEEEMVRAFSLGATDYVVKPFSPAELVARVRRLVRAG
ncbi:MAG TPA: response regulator [Gemmatimonadales bacterium]|nr:response regulator [Gemmatimonadales bacterium]